MGSDSPRRRFCHRRTNCWCFFLSCLPAGRRNAAEGVDEKARRCVQGDAVRCRTEHWKADEASIAREGRGILRIGAAVLRWMSLSGQHWKCSIERRQDAARLSNQRCRTSATRALKLHRRTQACIQENTRAGTKRDDDVTMIFWHYSFSPANRLANHVDPFSSYSALLTSTSFSSSGRLANCAAPSQVCLIGSSAREMFSR